MSKTHPRFAPDERPAPGAHLVTGRSGFTHHGIYVGDGAVVHYAGFCKVSESGPVEETTLEAFHEGWAMWERLHAEPRFTPERIVARARSRLGEKGYCLAANNCEHFAHWCIMGEHASAQVDQVVVAGTAGIGAAGTLAAYTAVAAAGAVQGLGASGIMSGLKAISLVGGGAVGGLINGPVAAGTGAALLLNHTVLRDRPGLTGEEKRARLVGRLASHAASAATVAGGVCAISASGAVAGLSGAGIASGLAAVGGLVGGGMAAGAVAVMAAPAVAAVGIGYGAYKVAQTFNVASP